MMDLFSSFSVSRWALPLALEGPEVGALLIAFHVIVIYVLNSQK